MIPRDNADDAFARDVRQILRAREIGLRWRDQLSATVEIPAYLAARAPYSVAVPGVPLSVECLRAENIATHVRESGCRVSWRGGRAAGTIDVTAIDVSDTAATYLVTLGFWMG